MRQMTMDGREEDVVIGRNVQDHLFTAPATIKGQLPMARPAFVPPWTKALVGPSPEERAEYALRVFGPVGGPIYLASIEAATARA